MLPENLIIYLNENNILRAKWDLIAFASQILKGSLIIEQLSSLKERINNQPIFDENNSFDKNLLFSLAKENLIDTIRLCIFYENVAKAQLIEQHFLIHNIDKNWSKELNKEQKYRPIGLNEIDKIEPFILDEINNKVSHIGILSQTISLNTILNNKLYIEKIDIPERITEFIKTIKGRRNELHLNLELKFEISYQAIEIIEQIDMYALSLIEELKKLTRTP